ncbi:MAG: hypothetical protein HRF42_08270 [Candidatus Brocadia sp.]|jgi:uncharacterized protein involved in exopolysaccharide biosynthesis
MAEKNLLEYWFVLYNKKIIILVITLSAMITAGGLSKILSPVYEAKAVFFVPKEPDTATFFAPGGKTARSPFAPEAKEDTQGPYIGILKSRTIAERVQKEFPHKRITDLMRRDINFVLSNEYMIEVYARDRDPCRAAGIANAYVKYFRQLMDGYSLISQAEKQATIEDAIASNERKLLEATEALSAFQQKNKTANMDEETRQLISMKTVFESQLETYQVSYHENKKRVLTAKRKLKEEFRTFNASGLVITSPLLEKLKEQLVDTEGKMASLRVEIKESHPAYMTLKKNYDEIKKNIDKEIDSIIKSQAKDHNTFYENLRRQLINLYIDKSGIKAAINATKKALRGIDARITKIPELKNQLDALTTEIERYKKIIDTLRIDLEEVKAQTRRTPQVAVMVEEAIPPANPSFPILWLNILVAGTAGILGGIFYCLFLNYLEETREKRIYRLWKTLESIKNETQ